MAQIHHCEFHTAGVRGRESLRQKDSPSLRSPFEGGAARRVARRGMYALPKRRFLSKERTFPHSARMCQSRLSPRAAMIWHRSLREIIGTGKTMRREFTLSVLRQGSR